MGLRLQKQMKRMSKVLSQKKRKGGNKLDQMDRFRQHLVEGKSLKKRDQIVLDKCLKVFTLLTGGYSDMEISKIADRAGWSKPSRTYQLISITKKIFGNAHIANKAAERIISIQMAKEAYKIAKQEGRAGDMVAATKLIAQLEGTMDEKHNLTIVYQNLTLPAIQITDDPKVINEVVEVEFEEG